MILLDAIRFSGFRSFQPDSQIEILALQSLNEFIGPNNNGKSNILEFLHVYLNQIYDAIYQGSSSRDYSGTDIPQGFNQQTATPTISIGMALNGDIHKEWRRQFVIERRDSFSVLENALIEDQYIWFCYKRSSEGKMVISDEQLKSLNQSTQLKDTDWQLMLKDLPPVTTGRQAHQITVMEQVVRRLTPLPFDSSKTLLLKEMRLSDQAAERTTLAERIATMRSPSYDQESLQRHFDKLLSFLKNVLGVAKLEIEATNETPKQIMLRLNGRRLPLIAYGSGVKSLISIGIECVAAQNQIIFIEEPELHLHPAAQRALLNYLVKETTNQYFVSTHSNSLIDIANSCIVHVRHDTKWSSVEVVKNHPDKLDICRSLGYKASDLMQTNCIIWVEGPSDVIYFRAWLRADLSQFTEGLHYSFMTYGGAILSNFYFDDDETTETLLARSADSGLRQLVNLLDLNRRCAVIMDSDKSSNSDSAVNDTKQRVLASFETPPNFAWITKGREIENYINPVAMKEALALYSKKFVEMESEDQFGRAWIYKNDQGRSIKADKVELASIVCRKQLEDFLDLKILRQRIVEFVQSSNE